MQQPFAEQHYPSNPMLPLATSGRLAPPPTTAPIVLSTKAADLSAGKRFRVATFLAIAFAALSSPYSFQMTNSIYVFIWNRTSYIRADTNSPTLMGILVHAAIFYFIALYLLYSS